MRRVAPLLTLIPALAVAAPVTYRIDPAETELLALTKPAGLLSGFSHPHVIAARGASGEVIHDEAAPSGDRVAVEARTDLLENDDPTLRARLGMKPLGEGDRKKVGEALRAADQLDVVRYPHVRFTSTAVRQLDDGRLEVTGKLDLRGVASEVRFPVQVVVREGVLRGEGAVRITHRQFGFRPVSAGGGTIRNADEIELLLRLVARTAR
jgi:polyisoprenoid-binding protein YceI